MKTKFYLLPLLALLSISSCSQKPIEDPKKDDDEPPIDVPVKTLDDCVSTEQANKYALLGYEPIFSDLNFKDGLRVSRNSSTHPAGPHYNEGIQLYKDRPYNPSWGMAQWSTQYDILDPLGDGYTHETSDDGLTHRLYSGGKLVNGVMLPAKDMTFDSYTGSIKLEANTQVEYDHPRQGNEGWVHLLMEQSFDRDLTFLNKYESIIMETTYTVSKFEDCMFGQADPNRHAAQFVWYITIQNRRGNHATNKDYGKYIWFGMGLWDNRSVGKVSGLYAAHDAGTDTLIYNPGSDKFLTGNEGLTPQVGEKVTARLDLMSMAKTAFDYAKKNNYLGDTKFEDLAIGGMNFGFEIPGTYNLGVDIDSIGVFKK